MRSGSGGGRPVGRRGGRLSRRRAIGAVERQRDRLAWFGTALNGWKKPIAIGRLGMMIRGRVGNEKPTYTWVACLRLFCCCCRRRRMRSKNGGGVGHLT